VRRYKKKKGKGNPNYRKGYNFEWEWLWYIKYHGFDPVRSYASKGVCDIRAVPPVEATIQLAMGAQCKNQKKEDYLNPKERTALLNLNLTNHYIICEPFKANRTCFVKMRPWELDGPILTPEEFLSKIYGIKNPMTWKEFKARHKMFKSRPPRR